MPKLTIEKIVVRISTKRLLKLSRSRQEGEVNVLNKR